MSKNPFSTPRALSLITGSLFAITTVFYTWAATDAHGAITWPQWRGADRDGLVPNGSKAWPSNLENLTALWNQGLGEGYSSPIVSKDRVFTVETKGKEYEIVRAFDRSTGEQIWETSWEGAMKVPFFARKNGSWVRCTPALDEGVLYVGGMRDVLVAIDARDGKVKWKVDFTEREGTELPAFGFVSSPLVDGNAVYVQAGAQVTKLDKRNGEKIWGAMKDDRAMYGSAFSSPVIATVGGVRQLVVQTRESLAGISLKSGGVLWDYKVKAFRGMNILTPVVTENTVFTSTYGGGSFDFAIGKEGESLSASKTWVNKTEGYMSTPIVYKGHAYLHGRDKKFHCIDLTDGSTKWATDEKFGQYWSMVANGDRLLALDEQGELLLIKMTPEAFTLLDRRGKIAKEPTWAHLAVCGDEVYVRDLKGITKWQWKP